MTKVPSHESGQCAVNARLSLGLHTDYMLHGGEGLFCVNALSSNEFDPYGFPIHVIVRGVLNSWTLPDAMGMAIGAGLLLQLPNWVERK